MSSFSEPRARVLRGRATRTVREVVLGLDLDPDGARSRNGSDPGQVRTENGGGGVSDAIVAGWSEGWAVGHEAGLAAAEAEVATAEAGRQAQVARALRALEQAAEGWRARQTTALAAVEDAVVDAALSLAAAVLDRELAVAQAPGAEALARALALAPPDGPLVARLHPDDIAALTSVIDVPAACSLSLLPDGAVRPGGCLLECGDVTIDAGVDAALARAREAMQR